MSDRPRFKHHPEFGICKWHDLQESYFRTGITHQDEEASKALADWLNAQDAQTADAVIDRVSECSKVNKDLSEIVIRSLPGWSPEKLADYLGAPRFDGAETSLDAPQEKPGFDHLVEEEHFIDEEPEVDEDGCIKDATITIQVGETRLTTTWEGMERVCDALEEMTETPHPVQVSGKGLHAIIKEFCETYDKKAGPRPANSVGLGERSVVATDLHRAILLGALEDKYRTSDRKRTLVEGDWSKRMEAPVRWNALPEMGQTSDIDNPVLTGLDIPGPDYPDVGAVIRANSLEGFAEIAGFDPLMLVAVGRVADALGSTSVTLLHDGQGKMMGFRFEALGFTGADEDAVGQPFPVQGLLCARAKDKEAKAEEEG